MNKKARPAQRPLRIRPYAVALAVVWTTVIVASLSWNLLQMRQDFVERARMEAHGSSDKDLFLQRWVTEHGGVYVPVTEKTPPNPNMVHVDERDIVTRSGRRLTLMNAAYVMRQLYSSGEKTHGIRGHFTSLDPIRPENAPDAWEASALRAFEQGQDEVSAIAMLDGQAYMRFMRPMVVEERCLKCHSEQGYEIGDIRGGFSVSVPMSPYWVQAPARIVPLLLGHGLIWVLGVVGIGFSARSVLGRVSERERAEEERLSLERQVQHAQKLKSLGVLAGGIAHDFNNLLTVILGNAHLALQHLPPDAPARGKVMEIEQATQRATSLAKEMLAYSGRGRFVIEPIRLNSLVEEMAHLLEASISKKATLSFNFAERLPAFEGDATQIRQIIMNLITNASEALRGESGTVSIATGAMVCDRDFIDTMDAAFRNGLEEPLPEGAYVYLDVADTGYGMERETLERIFDPFFTTKMTGRGLGMAAALGIVRGHKGLIKVTSKVGEGTTFRILFPVGQESSTAASVAERGEIERYAWSSGGTMLVVDDEEQVRSLAREMLERLGFSVLTAADGHEAVDIFRKHAAEIVCVLLDLTMPQLDGEQAFREMLAIRSDVKAILTSGYDEQEATRRFAGESPAGFLQKPYDLENLQEALREVMERKQTRGNRTS